MKFQFRIARGPRCNAFFRYYTELMEDDFNFVLPEDLDATLSDIKNDYSVELHFNFVLPEDLDATYVETVKNEVKLT